MKTKKVTYKCSADKTRTLDVNIGQDLNVVEHFVAYESEYPEYAFLPDCHDCEVGSPAMRIGDDLVMHMVKVCTITKVNELVNIKDKGDKV